MPLSALSLCTVTSISLPLYFVSVCAMWYEDLYVSVCVCVTYCGYLSLLAWVWVFVSLSLSLILFIPLSSLPKRLSQSLHSFSVYMSLCVRGVCDFVFERVSMHVGAW